MKRSGYSVHFHPAGAALLGAALLLAPTREVLAALAALLWHEAAHLAAFRCCGIRECRVELTPFGGMADPQAFDRLRPMRQAVCASAGVFASLFGMGCCGMLAPKTPFFHALMSANASLAMVNCLPAWPLDGARTLTALAAMAGCERGMRRLLHGGSLALGAGMIALALWGAGKGVFNPSLLLSGPYLWYVAGNGRVAERLRGLGRSAGKLKDDALLPVRLFATASASPPPGLLGHMAGGRYHVLLQLSPEGDLQKIWTEDEVLAAYLSTKGK